MAIKKVAFVVDKLPYKTETSRLALTHAISSQTVEIHLEEDENITPVLAFIGEGVLNCIKDQKAPDIYGITSLESHIKNALLTDIKLLICAEDVKRFGLSEDALIMDAEDLGADIVSEVVPFDDIMEEMNTSDHILFF
ncbi:MAG: DsrE family protein [Magnetococcales bacterium]|uniref:DsrE family protein n=1 Tax=Candidatus Magnetobacterium casense TaxID=1455061 RepID=A0ABS6RW47_9BACT|nr:DsrE family protein [Candidatus Magnetobacterium casensis]MBF0609328.1 DsrE family protein [Nitrospirota bacterium]MBV6340254.1 DsrE family protein [Candidatus Magnetobacterium casensis]